MKYSIIRYSKEYFLQYALLYQKIWRSEPYGEVFTIEEISNHIHNNMGFLFLCISINNNIVTGFVGGRPLRECAFFENKINIDINKCFYIDELGVHEDFRKEGLGKKLTNYLIDIALNSNFREFILRTHNSESNPAINFYAKLGFSKIKIDEEAVFGINTKQKRIDNRAETDFRPYFYKKY